MECYQHRLFGTKSELSKVFIIRSHWRRRQAKPVRWERTLLIVVRLWEVDGSNRVENFPLFKVFGVREGNTSMS